ncbi:MAG: primosomal protein N' [Armatimonadetes bacterium]|nr:primosomal protein N' [Armatimonadota bacterium]
MQADVVVNIAAARLGKTFTYRVPQHLVSSIEPGACVVVPFGRKEYAGYILELDPYSEMDGARDILTLLDNAPALTPDLLALTQWMAQEYLCYLTDCIHCMLPEMTASVAYVLKLGPAFDSKKLWDLTPYPQQIVRWIDSEGGRIPLERIREQFPLRKLGDILRKLKGSGWLTEVGEVELPRTGVRRVNAVRLAILPEQVPPVIEQIERSAPKQAAILKECLAFGDRFVAQVAIARRAGVNPKVVSSLIEKGLLEQGIVEIRKEALQAATTGQAAPVLSPDQRKASQRIRSCLYSGKPRFLLLHGVTGSGKTEIYLRAIEEARRQGKQSIVLVPEISLTAQTLAIFSRRFGPDVAVWHSKLSTGERHSEWQRARRGEAAVILGARSAVFAPFPKLGLIILDEEHETSYKQDSVPRYDTRQVALERARLTGSTVVFGSATPAVESFYAASTGAYDLLSLKNRIAGREMPPVRVLDLRQENQNRPASVFGACLEDAVRTCLGRGEQAILFLNRRAYSTFQLCRDCGFTARCPHCSVTLKYHLAARRLECHHCDHYEAAHAKCPKCGGERIKQFGIGTERVEEESRVRFPDARILRMDRDTTGSKRAYEDIYRAFHNGEADILIGTQMVAKGFDFPKVTLVGVISADVAINLPDFRSGERTFQLLTQVSGRAGRAELPGEVIVQTFSPEHYAVQAASRHDYLEFYNQEIAFREELRYPPFSRLVNIVVSDTLDERADARTRLLCERIRKAAREVPQWMEVLGPTHAPLAKLRGKYRWHFIMKAAHDAPVQALLEEVTDQYSADDLAGVSIDVDAVSML